MFSREPNLRLGMCRTITKKSPVAIFACVLVALSACGSNDAQTSTTQPVITQAPTTPTVDTSLPPCRAGCLRANGMDFIGTCLPDCSGINVNGTDLRNANLSGVNLNQADLSFVDLAGANLSNANLKDAYLYSANLTGANLTGANMTGANLTDADLTGATMPDGSLHD